MATAYTPGLKVVRRTLHREKRVLPIPGEVLCRTGDSVSATDVIARTSMPGDVVPVNVAAALGVSAGDVKSSLLVAVGGRVEAGQPLARSRGLFGWFPRELAAPASGTVESVSSVTGQVMLRGVPRAVEVLAHLSGRVVEVLAGQGATVEAGVTLVQGIFGLGGEAYGRIAVACRRPEEPLTPERISPEMRGGIVVGGGRTSAATVRRAVEVGVAAIVTGGLDDVDLRELLGYDLGVAVTGTENIGLTLVITEGFGDVSMSARTHALLVERAGADASISGATQIRAGVLRPQVVIPWPDSGTTSTSRVPEVGLLEPGRPVRIIRDPYFGLVGTVSALPHAPALLESGSFARVLEVALTDGRRLTVPRANVELIETEVSV
jgi:hypothetical protein